MSKLESFNSGDMMAVTIDTFESGPAGFGAAVSPDGKLVQFCGICLASCTFRDVDRPLQQRIATLTAIATLTGHSSGQH
jgi:hypothetical protein